MSHARRREHVSKNQKTCLTVIAYLSTSKLLAIERYRRERHRQIVL